MRLATIRTGSGDRAARLDGEHYVEVEGYADVGRLLAEADWHQIAGSAAGARHPVDAVGLAPVIPQPDKIICVGANYRDHIAEMDAEVPEYPTLFTKYPQSLVGAFDPILLPPEDPSCDWEGELAVVIGKPARRVPPADVDAFVAGYSVFNDVSMRTFQMRTTQWLQGKSWESSSPFGPWLVTADEYDPRARIMTRVNGECVQEDSVQNTIFSVAEIVSYVSTMITLLPGDTIITGTPAGVGAGRVPPRFLRPDDVLETEIAGLGRQVNRIEQDNRPR